MTQVALTTRHASRSSTMEALARFGLSARAIAFGAFGLATARWARTR
jgi:hypothetical protein